jgi:hypothetical protein
MFLLCQHRSKVAVLGACWGRAWQTELIPCSIKPCDRFQEFVTKEVLSKLSSDVERKSSDWDTTSVRYRTWCCKQSGALFGLGMNFMGWHLPITINA